MLHAIWPAPCLSLLACLLFDAGQPPRADLACPGASTSDTSWCVYPQQGNGPDAPQVVLEWMKRNLPKVAFDELRNYLLTMKANDTSATSSRRDTVDLTADDPPGQQQQMQQQAIAALSQASYG
jgi:hypothetical protein